MPDCTIKLIGPPTRTQGADGVWRTTAATETEVFAKQNSVSRNEFFAAGNQGMRPEYVFSVFAGEYNGQTVCEYNGERYAIYRTYRPEDSDYMELYAHRDVGIHSAQTNPEPTPTPVGQEGEVTDQ